MTTPDLPCSPAAERNRGPILAQLQRWLGPEATLLELASGTGQHAAHCAAAMPGWTWQPTEADLTALPVIEAWCTGLPNVRPPRRLDVRDADWPAADGAGWDVVYCANLVHIAPWPVALALLRGAAHVLAPQGQLLTYGPYIVDGEPLAEGNRAFDADLRHRDPAWGLRRLADLQAAAADVGLALAQRAAMPANNLMLRWRRP